MRSCRRDSRGVRATPRSFPGRPSSTRSPGSRRWRCRAATGLLGVAYLVETWSQKGNLLHHTLIGGGGDVRGVENRTAKDSYKVFPVSTPWPGQATRDRRPAVGSPGAQTTINIKGNNANAYLDTDANNAPDGGGTAVTDGNFVTTADLLQAPTTDANRAVSVQNLFYLNNVIHDALYRTASTRRRAISRRTTAAGAGRGPTRSMPRPRTAAAPTTRTSRPRRTGRTRGCRCICGAASARTKSRLTGETYKAMGAAFGPASTVTGRRARWRWQAPPLFWRAASSPRTRSSARSRSSTAARATSSSR